MSRCPLTELGQAAALVVVLAIAVGAYALAAIGLAP